MSYELVNRSTEIKKTFSRQAWPKTLELARLYGWQPMGTCPPPAYDFQALEADWNGTYLTNDGQLVRAEDAYSLADALEKSLADIPDVGVKIDWTSQFWLEDPLPEWFSPDEKALMEEELMDGLLDTLGIPPLEFFAGDDKQYLAEFIRFCRLGSFEIV